jgi:hypothetical protein
MRRRTHHRFGRNGLGRTYRHCLGRRSLGEHYSSNLPRPASAIPIYCVKARSRNYSGICTETNKQNAGWARNLNASTIGRPPSTPSQTVEYRIAPVVLAPEFFWGFPNWLSAAVSAARRSRPQGAPATLVRARVVRAQPSLWSRWSDGALVLANDARLASPLEPNAPLVVLGVKVR